MVISSTRDYKHDLNSYRIKIKNKFSEPLQICRQKLEDKTENQNEQEAVMIFIQKDIVKIFIG